MKSLLALLLGSILLFACLASAQPRLLAGVNVGGMLADIRGKWNEDAPQKFKTGLIAGGELEYQTDTAPLWKHAAIRFEAAYTQKGFKDQVRQTDEEGRDLGWMTSGTVHVDEIVLAAFYSARFPTQGIIPFVELGPEIGFPLRAKEHFELDGGSGTWYDLSYWSKKPNIGLNFGFGAAVPVATGELSLDARYNLGLTNMFRYEHTILGDNITAYTNGFQVLLGYSFSVMNQ